MPQLVVYFRFFLNHLFEATAHKYYEALILSLPLHSNEIKQDRKIMILKKSSMSAELILSRPLGRLFQSRSRKKRKKQETFFSCWQILIILWYNFVLVIKQIMESLLRIFSFEQSVRKWERLNSASHKIPTKLLILKLNTLWPNLEPIGRVYGRLSTLSHRSEGPHQRESSY